MGNLSKHFSRYEFECHDGCGCNTIDVELLPILEKIRNHFGKPVKINSAYRCKTHNAAVGGSPKSQHLLGKAADIVIQGVSPSEVADYAESILTNYGGVGRYTTFTHIDVREKMSRWSIK